MREVRPSALLGASSGDGQDIAARRYECGFVQKDRDTEESFFKQEQGRNKRKNIIFWGTYSFVSGFGLSYLIFNNWKTDYSDDLLTALLVAPDRYSTIRECLIVFISLSAVISALGRAADLYKEIVLPRWLKNNHVDPVGGVKEYLELTKDEGEIERDVLMRGAFYCADPSKKILEYLAFAGQLLLDVAVAVAIYYMGMEIFSQNIQGVLTELPSDTGAVFQAMAPALIAAGVGGALMLICDVAKWALRSRWFKQNNFPDS